MITLNREKIEQFQKVVYRFFRDNDVKKAIAEDTEEIIKEWNPDLKEGEELLMCPDLRLSFGVDGLESSIESEKWVYNTDSGISLSIGRREILQMM